MSASNSSMVSTEYLSPTKATVEEVEKYDLEFIYRVMFLYVPPFLIFGGTAGNALSFAVLQGKSFRKSPSSFILSALAMVDTAVLLTALLRHWIRALTGGQVDVRFFSQTSCRVHYLFVYMFRQLSSWTLIMMTFERLLSVTIPLKAREICSRKKMVAAWIAVALSLFALNAHVFKTTELLEIKSSDGNETVITYDCGASPGHEWFVSKFWPVLDFTIAIIVPFLFIAIANAVIIRQVVRSTRMRQEQMQAKGDDSGVESLTRMLIIVSVVFLLTTTPSGIFFVAADHWPAETPHDIYKQWIAYAVTNTLYYTNNSINFLLYCLSGSRFRRALVSMLCCRNEKKTQSSASKYTMSTRAPSKGPHTTESDIDNSHM